MNFYPFHRWLDPDAAAGTSQRAFGGWWDGDTAASDTGVVAGRLGMAGVTQGVVARSGAAVARLGMSAAAAGVVERHAYTIGTLGMSAAAAGVVERHGTAAAQLGMSAALAGDVGYLGAAVARLSMGGALEGTTPSIKGRIPGALSMSAAAQGVVNFTGAVAGQLGMAGVTQGIVARSGAAAAALSMSGVQFGVVNFSGAAAGRLGMAGITQGVVARSGAAAGALGMSGGLLANVPTPPWTANVLDSTHLITDGPRINAAVLDYANANNPSGIGEAGRLGTGTSIYLNAPLTRLLTDAALGDLLYFEVELVELTVIQNTVALYNSSYTVPGTQRPGIDANSWGFHANSTVTNNNTDITPTSWTTWSVGERLQFAVKVSTGEVWVRKDGGSWLGDGSTPDPAAGTGPAFTISNLTGVLAGNAWGGGGTGQMRYNFGQRNWANAPPAGFTGIGGF